MERRLSTESLQTVEIQSASSSDDGIPCKALHTQDHHWDQDEMMTFGDKNTDLIFNCQIENLRRDFLLCTATMPVSESFIRELLDLHANRCGHLPSFVAHLKSVATQFVQFASHQQLFRSFSAKDRNVLLSRNTDIFLQYTLSRYFSADNGLDQISWMMDSHVPLLQLDAVQRLQFVSIQEFDRTTKILRNKPSLIKLYNHFIREIGEHFTYPQFYTCLIANAILYYCDDTMHLQEEKRISYVYSEALSLLRIGCADLSYSLGNNFPQLMATLQKMNLVYNVTAYINYQDKNYFYSPVSWIEEITSATLLSSSVDLNNTIEERQWLQIRLECFQRATECVPAGGEVILACASLSRDKPIPPTMMVECTQVIIERARQVAKLHPEFNEFSDTDQQMLWRRNYLWATVLSMAKSECSDGKQQMRKLLGKLDDNDEDTEWESVFDGLMNLNSIKPLSMEAVNKQLGLMDEHTMQEYNRLSRIIGTLVQKNIAYKLAVLIMMFDNDGHPKATAIQKIYMRQLCLVQAQTWNKSDPQEIQHHLNNVFHCVKQLGCIVKSLTRRP